MRAVKTPGARIGKLYTEGRRKIFHYENSGRGAITIEESISFQGEIRIYRFTGSPAVYENRARSKETLAIGLSAGAVS